MQATESSADPRTQIDNARFGSPVVLRFSYEKPGHSAEVRHLVLERVAEETFGGYDLDRRGPRTFRIERVVPGSLTAKPAPVGQLVQRLLEAEEAIAKLPADILGAVGNDDESWPIRDELLGRIRATLSRVTEVSDAE